MKTSQRLLFLTILFLLPACTTLQLPDFRSELEERIPDEITLRLETTNAMALDARQDSTDLSIDSIVFNLTPNENKPSASDILTLLLTKAAPSDLACVSDSLSTLKEKWEKFRESVSAEDSAKSRLRRIFRPVKNDSPPNYKDVFVVTAKGNVLRAPSGSIDEGTHVHVVAYASQLTRQYLKIKQTGTIDDPNDRAIFGQPDDVKIPKTTFDIILDEDEEASAEDGKCGVYYARMSPYYPGTGSFEVIASVGNTEVSLGEVAFPVRRRYIGTLTFGGMYSFLESPSYTLMPVDPTDNNTLAKIVETEMQSRRAHLVAGFAPVLWRPRSISGELKPRIDWFFGVDITKPMDNLFVGLTLNLNGVFLVHGGFHVGKIQVLPEDADAEVPANTDLSKVLVDEWKRDYFIGVSIDTASATAAFSQTIRGLLR